MMHHMCLMSLSGSLGVSLTFLLVGPSHHIVGQAVCSGNVQVWLGLGD